MDLNGEVFGLHELCQKRVDLQSLGQIAPLHLLDVRW